jgi:hypothetical protein
MIRLSEIEAFRFAGLKARGPVAPQRTTRGAPPPIRLESSVFAGTVFPRWRSNMRRAVFLSSAMLCASLQNAAGASKAPAWPSPPATGAGETSAFPLTAEMKSKVEAAISDSSTHVAALRMGRRYAAVRTESGIHVCGMVDIKHSSGAFTGAKPFYAMGDRAGAAFALVGVGGNPQADEHVRLLCSVHGIK